MTEEEVIRRGAKAGQELELTAEAFEALKAKYIADILASEWDDTAGRERLCLSLKSLNTIQYTLQGLAIGGETARAALAFKTAHEAE